jgi:galactonate dehydratase
VKITAIECTIVDAFRTNFVFVRVSTDAGITGVGEGTVEYREQTVVSAISELARSLVGQDPFRIEHHMEMLNRDSYWRTGVILRSSLAAVEVALHDIKAKALGVSVVDLLGGRQRERIKCYANGWYVGAKGPDGFAEKASAAVALGFKGLKWDPFGSAYLEIDAKTRIEALDTIAAVRAAVGDGIELMIEGHGRFNVPTAIALAKQMAEFRPAWFEEPIPPENIDSLAEVRRHAGIPIAAGERYYEPQRFVELIAKDAVDIVQPDILHVGGLGATKFIASLAHAHYKPIAVHNPQGPIGNAASLQLAASVPNFCWLETMMTDVPWRADIVSEDLELIDGEMTIGSGPGLGIDFDEEACAHHPYQLYELRHYSGALTKIRPPDARPFYRVERAAEA